MMKSVFGTLIVLAIAALGVGQVSGTEHFGGISGHVRLPDGMPSAEATVTAVTDCEKSGEGTVRFSQEVKTSADGAFYVPPFSLADTDCNRIRLSAQKTDELWLRTGHDVFDGSDNGTAPIVDTHRSGPPATAEIVLGERGASVSFRVLDTRTGQFVRALLHLKRIPVHGKKFGSMSFATGLDGSADTLLLPAGQYEVEVDSLSGSSSARFVVEAGQRTTKDIPINVGHIKPAKPHANSMAS